MRKYYTGTLCSKVGDIQNIIRAKKWGIRDEDIREIEQLVGYIHEDGQSMEDKLYERKAEVEELKDNIKNLEKEVENLKFYLDDAKSNIDR